MTVALALISVAWSSTTYVAASCRDILMNREALWDVGGRQLSPWWWYCCSGAFFDKGNILILRRYQLHPASTTTQTLMALQMHTAKKEEETKKGNVPLQSSSPCSSTTTKITPDIQILQKRRLQEENRVQARSSPDQRSWVFTLKIVPALKTKTSTKPLLDKTN